MSLGSLVLVLVLVWCTIYLVHYLSARKATAHLLPTTSTNINTIRHRSRYNTTVTLRALHFRVSTTRWNILHDQLASILTRPRYHRITSLLRGLYNLGVILGAVGMLIAIGLCVLTAWNGFNEILLSDRLTESPVVHVKRAVELATNNNKHPRNGWPVLKPIIPGLTVPLSHLPIILVAVFASQIVHEFGHAIAAALESLPMLAAGASLTICIPAAFITFPYSATNNMSNQARSRVTAAGPFHNLAFWCFILALSRLGIDHLAAFISGYKNLSSLGKVVVDVDVSSPLYVHLSKGSIITHLDDTPLSASNLPDPWVSYLTGFRPELSLGWCADASAFEASQSCCVASSPSKEPTLACFASIDEVVNRGCIDPVPLLTALGNQTRCKTTSDCSSDSTCVIPHRKAKLMRLRVWSTDDDEKTILWNGSTEEVFQEVQVGDWLPRFRFLPLWLPSLVQSFWEYLSMATLSLYLFNLLPVPYLDGSQLLSTFLDALLEDRRDLFTYDLESLSGEMREEEPSRFRDRWKETIMRIVHSSVVGTVISCIVLASVNAWR